MEHLVARPMFSELVYYSITSLNLCSIIRKFDEIKNLIQTSEIDIFAINETFLNHSIDSSELHINGYNIIRADRTAASGKNGGGGLIIYYSDKYTMEQITDSHLCTPNIECVSLKVKLRNVHEIIFTSVYRAPDGHLADSLTDFENYYHALNVDQRSDLLVVGEWNVDLSREGEPMRNLTNLMKEFNLSQLINMPQHPHL